MRGLKFNPSNSHALYNSPALEAFQHPRAELSVAPPEVTLHNTKQATPVGLQGHVMKLTHKGHIGMLRTKQLLHVRLVSPDGRAG